MVKILLRIVVIVLLLICVVIIANTFIGKYTHSKDIESCEKGELEACYLAGDSLSKSLGANRDYLNANKYFAKACEGNYLKACKTLGLRYSSGFLTEKVDDEKANLYLKKACDLEDKTSCLLLKDRKKLGIGVNKT